MLKTQPTLFCQSEKMY